MLPGELDKRALSMGAKDMAKFTSASAAGCPSMDQTARDLTLTAIKAMMPSLSEDHTARDLTLTADKARMPSLSEDQTAMSLTVTAMRAMGRGTKTADKFTSAGATSSLRRKMCWELPIWCWTGILFQAVLSMEVRLG
jgi:hypothetical protein